MHNTELVQQTVDDVRELLDKILERHREDPTFCLRTESVFNQYINSLSYITGNVNERSNIFSPKPLESIAGKKVNPRDTDKLELKPIEVDEVEAFRKKIKLIHDGFLNRENTDILDSLQEIEIRGVAKIVGIEDFDTAPVDGVLVQRIKDAITVKKETETKQEELKDQLNADQNQNIDGNDSNVATKETETKQEEKNLSPAEMKAIKDKAVADYTELFGTAPDNNLSAKKIQELIDSKKAE